MATRKGTGAIVKFFKRPGEGMATVMAECDALTDKDVEQLSEGIGSVNSGGIAAGSLTY